MTSKNLLEALQAMEFTHGLEPEHLERLASMATEASFSEGEILFREGDMCDVVYLVREGQVAIRIHVPGRGRVNILTVGPGQLVGWSSLFARRHMTATGCAVAATRAIAIDADKLRAACEEDHHLGHAVVWRVAGIIAERLKATRLQLLDMFASGPST